MFLLESPKSTVKDGYFYLTSAEGGTAGPATSHMVVCLHVQNHPYGPWENSPYNPIIHTENRAEQWWSQGHGTLVGDVDGNYWMMYHGYKKGFHSLGRQTLMMPIEWTEDNWFRVPEGINSSDALAMPAGETSVENISLSDDFDSNKLAWPGRLLKPMLLTGFLLKMGHLFLKPRGNHSGIVHPFWSIHLTKI